MDEQHTRRTVAEATRTLATLTAQADRLHEQIAQIRGYLSVVHGDAVDDPARIAFAQTGHAAGRAQAAAQDMCGHPVLDDLREANEMLVIAAMSAHQMQEQADETHRRQITFLAMVAHELRNPLAPIRSAADLLAHACNDGVMIERLQGIIKRQVDHLTRLVDDLLDGARVKTGTFRLDRRALELADALGAAIEATQPAINARRQSLTVQLPPGPLPVDGDPVRLAQVFGNLLHNAAKYTPEGGTISLWAIATHESVEVTVADNGIGITATTLPHIFDLYVQDARSVAHDKSGLGIGLAVVRDLVEGHGGRVTASSHGHDAGSEFVVTLPLSTRS